MAAVIEVLGTIKSALELAGLTVEIDRGEDDPVSDTEGDVVVLSWDGAESSQPTWCANYLWTAQVGIAVWAVPTSLKTLLERMTEMTRIVSEVFGADPTFGGKFHDSAISATGGMESTSGDRGSIPITAAIQYFTTKSDITTISTD